MHIIFNQIGAGHGKFTCLVLQHLLEMREFLPTLSQKSEQTNGGVPSERGVGTGVAENGTDENETLEGGLGAGQATAGGGAGGSDGAGGKARTGMAEGLPFRYVMTDVAQVSKRICARILAFFLVG